MLFRTIFLSLFVFDAIKFAKLEPMEVKFDISLNKVGTKSVLSCDHNSRGIIGKKNKYTVLEGEDLKIIILFKSSINYLRCAQADPNNKFNSIKTSTKNVFMVAVLKSMGGVWNCMVLTNMSDPTIEPVVTFENNTYTAAYCYMQLHVRQKIAPQTILVNNVVLEPVRTNLSVKDIDFTAEYKYDSNDIKVDVNCFMNHNDEAQLSMTFDKDVDSLFNPDFNSPLSISSDSDLGIRGRFWSIKQLICIYRGLNDFTKVLVEFIYLKYEFENIIHIEINGLRRRPQPKYTNKSYEFVYKYITNESLGLVCQADRTDVKLKVIDHLVETSKLRSYQKPNVADIMAMVSFKSADNREINLTCTAQSKKTGDIEETVGIQFTPRHKSFDQCEVHIDLSVEYNVEMELYESSKLKIIVFEIVYYGEELTINCSATCTPGLITYVHFNDLDTWGHSSVSNVFHLTYQQETTVQSCYLKEQVGPTRVPAQDKLLKETRVIFREQIRPMSHYAPLTILVNNMVLETPLEFIWTNNFGFTAEYVYSDGDVVDVNCAIDSNDEAQLSMTFDYADSLSRKFNSAELLSDSRLGFRARLSPKYNNSVMACIYRGLKHDTNKFFVNFIMQAKFDNSIINVRLNGKLIRPQNNFHGYENTITYTYITNEHLELVCGTNRDGVKLEFEDQSHDSVIQKMNETETAVVIKSDDNMKRTIVCTVTSTTSKANIKNIFISFIPIKKTIDSCPMHISLPPNNILLELYDSYRLKVIYYEFEEGDILPIQCNITCEPEHFVYMQVGNLGNFFAKPKITMLNLTHEYDDSVLLCHTGEQQTAREIKVIFREKVPTGPPTTGTQLDANHLTVVILTSMGAVMILSIVIFWMKQRYCMQSEGPQGLPPLQNDPYAIFYQNHGIFRRQYEMELQAEHQYEEIEMIPPQYDTADQEEEHHYEKVEVFVPQYDTADQEEEHHYEKVEVFVPQYDTANQDEEPDYEEIS